LRPGYGLCLPLAFSASELAYDCLYPMASMARSGQLGFAVFVTKKLDDKELDARFAGSIRRGSPFDANNWVESIDQSAMDLESTLGGTADARKKSPISVSPTKKTSIAVGDAVARPQTPARSYLKNYLIRSSVDQTISCQKQVTWSRAPFRTYRCRSGS